MSKARADFIALFTPAQWEHMKAGCVEAMASTLDQKRQATAAGYDTKQLMVPIPLWNALDLLSAMLLFIEQNNLAPDVPTPVDIRRPSIN